MSPTETVTVLRQLMHWRRDKSNWPPSPMQIEKAIAAAIEMIEHLESAEKSDAESLAMYRRLCDERDALRTENAALVDDMNLLRNNNMTLRAKVAEMEQQAPAYWGPKHAIEGGSTTVIVGKFPVNPTDTPLYALPGAKGEEK